MHVSFELKKCEKAEADVKQSKTQLEERQKALKDSQAAAAKQHQKQQRETEKTHKDVVKKMKTKHAEEVKRMTADLEKVVHLIMFYVPIDQ